MPAAQEPEITSFSRLVKLLRGQLVGNALSLYAVQGLNYLMPLLLLPFLLRALSPQGYGSIMFAQALIGYAVILTEFGFNFTAARDISIARDNPQEVARIYWTTMAAKLVLLTISLLLVAAVVALTPRFRHDWPIFVASTLILLGNVAFPQWYFQGLEKLKDVAIVQAVSKCVVTASAIFMVRTADDIYTAAVILASPQLMGAIVAQLMGRRLAPAMFYRSTLQDVQRAISTGWAMFIGNASSTLYGNTNTFVLGLMSGEVAVAHYNLGTKVISMIQGLATPVVQAIFPRAGLIFSRDYHQGWMLIVRVAKLLLPPIMIICALTWLLAPHLILLLGGVSFADAVSTLRFMLPVPVLVALGMLLAHCVMVNIGLSGDLMRVYVIVGLMNLAMLPFLIRTYSADGAAVSLTVSEALVEVFLILILRKQNKKLKKTSAA